MVHFGDLLIGFHSITDYVERNHTDILVLLHLWASKRRMSKIPVFLTTDSLLSMEKWDASDLIDADVEVVAIYIIMMSRHDRKWIFLCQKQQNSLATVTATSPIESSALIQTWSGNK